MVLGWGWTKHKVVRQRDKRYSTVLIVIEY